MIKVCILDYGSGNVMSVQNLIQHLKIKSIVSNKNSDIKNSTHIILPGVGAFGESIKKLKKKIDIKYLEKEILVKKKPFLGICVGMQLLADTGEEFGKHKGLGWIKGQVVKLKSKSRFDTKRLSLSIKLEVSIKLCVFKKLSPFTF